jgi:hypothetical protein
MNRWTRLGIEAYRAGNREQAQRFFRFALMEKPDDIRTLLWLVEVANTDSDKERCLEQVLEIDPNQTLARQALLEVKSRIQSIQLPHVNPFSTDGSEGQQPSTPAFIEVRSTPPFMEALAERNTPAGSASSSSSSEKSGAGTFFHQKWLWAGLAAVGLVLVIFVILQAF